MTVRFGVRQQELQMAVQAVEDGRRIAELTFLPMDVDVMGVIRDEMEDEGVFAGARGAPWFTEVRLIDRCLGALDNLERMIGYQVEFFMALEGNKTNQLDLAESARMWRVAVIAAARRNACVMAPLCTQAVNAGAGAPGLAKAWKLPEFRAGLLVSGPVAIHAAHFARLGRALPAAANMEARR